MSPTGPSYGTAFTANPALKTTLVKAFKSAAMKLESMPWY